MELDETDRAIIEVLRSDARASMTTLAEEVHISRAGAHARVKRLRDSGVITGFTVRTDPVRFGQHASAYVTLSVEQPAWQDVRARLMRIPEVEHIALVGGEFDVLLLVRARDNRDLRRVVLEEVQAIPSVRTSRTLLIFEDFPNLPAGERRAAALNS
ncbi:Lrp/AsnC family transcriptional regulator [Leucobacter chromiireducens]|uniref:Lrp/AsnC family transcriptional regulator n=1 Tax=Leucobacter chromiireducens TaxID=283877 RepID=UPI0019280C87|nr:Lrp/AsnC family transcriptional regulator [Leucobacter chromiireducens]